jgi:alginate O-acetyltransferase complex protein AlgI
MLFNSLVFLYAFLPVTYVVFWALRSKNQRYVWLALTGYVFYGFWDYRFCALMAFSTLVSFTAGLGFLRWESGPKRRACLVVPIAVDLALLGFFKYADFGIETANAAGRALGHPLDVPLLHVVLPIGISFYTFHTISYIVDCYRGVVRPTRNAFEFACYVSLFSQLVAGPIVRFREIEADLDGIDASDRREGLERGLSHFCIGLAKKVLLADTVAAVINPALENYAALGTIETWACVLGYTFQLYFDFSGYSDMAIGLGRMFGLTIPRNFNSPYKALDISDFWRRWHISLSTCLRDYLYVPFGGNRGSSFATFRNLMLTMALGGLWHGAAWTFVIWGVYHGLVLAAYRAVGPVWDRRPEFLRRAATFLLVVVGCVVFRSDSVGMAGHLLASMFTWRGGAGIPGFWTLVIAVCVLGWISWTRPNTHEMPHTWSAPVRIALAGVFALCLFWIYAGAPSPFLYFQF